MLVTGGTGLYVKCLTEGFDEVPPENETLRAELERLDFHALEKRAMKDAAALYATLTGDDRRNPRRLIRLLEKMAGGSQAARPASDSVRPSGTWNRHPKPTLVGLHVEREILVQRIEQRVEKMYASGLLDEARELMNLDLSETALQAIGYAEAFAVLRNEITVEAAKEQTIIRTRQLAKRQMTWFRNQLNVDWIDAATFPSIETLADAVAAAWEKNGTTAVKR